MQSSLTSHTDFINEIKSVELKQEVNDAQAIFDSIKFDLLTKLSRNIINYSKDYCFKYFVKYQKEERYNKLTFYELIIEIKEDYFVIGHYKGWYFHKDILKCKGEMNGGSCKLCKYNGFKLKDQYMYENHQTYSNYTKEQKIKLKDEHNKNSIKWFEQNYDKILENIIIHPELLILIKKLCYQDFYNLFTSYEPFNINYVDSYQFISLIAFIGTNGYNEKYMKLNELE
jgi:hypothetical protein